MAINTTKIGTAALPLNVDNKLNVVYSSGSASDISLPLGGRNIALVLLSGGTYALPVIIDGSASTTLNTSSINHKRLALKSSGTGYCLYSVNTAGSTTVSGDLMINGIRLATNAAGDLICQNTGYTIESSDYVFWGETAIRVGLSSGKYYLVLGQ